MTLRKRGTSVYGKLSMGVSYKLLDPNGLYDARNIFDNKNVTETRHGIKRYNSTQIINRGFTLDASMLDVDYLGDDIDQEIYTRALSGSFFKVDSSTRHKLVKIGTAIYSVAASGNHTIVKANLSATTKHRGVTLGSRHIISTEDALYSWNGTTFTQLGQAAPGTLTATNTSGGSLTDTSQYQAAITFYASSIGFESNKQTSAIVTIAAATGLTLSLSDIPDDADNDLIDKVRIYLKNVTTDSEFLYVDEIDIGTTTYEIEEESLSTQTPPETHGAPSSGGGKYLAVFGKCIAYCGNSTYPDNVFISEDYLPDAFDNTETSKTLTIPGLGETTGIATGFYNNSYLNPYLVIFKRTSTHIYSELNGQKVQATLDDHVGCVSHETIRVRNGVVYFMSENGWYAIENGQLRKKDGNPLSLGNGAIDDIFSREGWAYQLNTQQLSNCFSAYYSTLGHYMTFVAEGGNDNFYKAYNYEERIGGFRVYQFKTPITCAFEGEDDNGRVCLFFGDADGRIYTFSVANPRRDEDSSAASQTIPAFFYLPFTMPGDDSCTYNFRELILKAISSENLLTVRGFHKYSMSSSESMSFDFTNDAAGFTLDVSQLDVDVLGDERTVTPYGADINRTGEVMILGFFQDILNANMGLISSQLFYNKNGNRNA
jgi:hypothetical protein